MSQAMALEPRTLTETDYRVQYHKLGIIAPVAITDDYRAKMKEIEKELVASGNSHQAAVQMAGKMSREDLQRYDLVGLAAAVDPQGLYRGIAELNQVSLNAYLGFQKSIGA